MLRNSALELGAQPRVLTDRFPILAVLSGEGGPRSLSPLVVLGRDPELRSGGGQGTKPASHARLAVCPWYLRCEYHLLRVHRQQGCRAERGVKDEAKEGVQRSETTAALLAAVGTAASSLHRGKGWLGSRECSCAEQACL